MATLIYQIQTVNRVGITHDVIECFTSNNVDIIGMDVKPYYIYLKTAAMGLEIRFALLSSIRKVQGVQHVEMINYLPSEERENRMDTILSTISEGIVSLDDALNIRTLNRAAEEMLHIGSRSAIGNFYTHLFKTKSEELERCLREECDFQNIPVTFPVNKNNTTHFIASYFPIRSADSQEAQGVVIVLRDMKQIQDLIQSVNRTGLITLDEIIHESTSMKQCIETAKKIVKTNATVFLYGESGTGKDLFARAIHYESPRAGNPFVPINCAALPESLLESELFGYSEGAFTGAVKGGKAGLFEMAQGGTLFLDEIGEMPIHLQAKLLRVIEDRNVRRIGGTKSTSIDVRIIAATNRNLAEMAKKGQFREDLFYRLHVIPIYIPPLRERKGDILLLAEFFLKRFCQVMNRSAITLSFQAMQALQTYQWPGNVRELQNVIERTVYLSPEEVTVIDQIDLELEAGASHPTDGNPLPAITFKEKIEAYEKNLLQNALQTYKTARKTAVHLGLSHTAILNKMKKYKLDGHSERG